MADAGFDMDKPPEGWTLFVEGLAPYMVGVEYTRKDLVEATHKYLGTLIEKTSMSLVMLLSPMGGMLQHRMPPAARKAATQMAYIYTAGPDKVQDMVKLAWENANNKSAPEGVEGYGHFGTETLLQTIRAFTGKTKR